MSKVKIQGNASGTGVLTVTAPNTSTDRTITLPDTTGTLLDENSSVPAANLTGTVATARLGTGTAGSGNFLRGDGSWQAAGSTSASDLTSGTLPAARIANTSILAEKLALGASNIRTTDQAVIAYKNLDGSGHFELKSFTIPERGIWQINAELRMGFSNNAGFFRTYYGVSSAGGQVGNARMIIENLGNSSNGTANANFSMCNTFSFGEQLTYPYTVYLNGYQSGTASSSVFIQSDTNGYPTVHAIKLRDQTANSGMTPVGV